MSFIAFKISDYDYTAEREQYRTICKLLREKYLQSDELCVFIANYNIFDCELDGIVIKSDAIIAVEFKNYSGNVLAVENGHWRLSDGTIIKGGSNKSVYQQAKINHVALKQGLKEGKIIPNKMSANIPSLIVFAQPISLTNNLGKRTKSWLHVCDIDHFIDKIEDITSPKFYLTNEQILDLIPKLGLIEEFVDTRFTVDVNINPIDSALANDNIVDRTISDTLEETSQPIKRISQSRNLYESEDAIKDSFQKFLNKNIVPLLNIEGKYSLFVVHFRNYIEIIGKPLPFQSEYVAILYSKGAITHIDILQRIFHKNVVALSNSIIVWPEGDIQSSENSITAKKPTGPSSSPQQRIKNNTIDSDTIVSQEIIKLPEWLDNLIFHTLGAKYQPSYERFSYNLDLNGNEAKIYLGTYFPRSFAESNIIFNQICKSSIVQSAILTKSEIQILDFGCGSGGATFGVLNSIEESFSAPKNIRIIGVDGNQNSLKLLDKITRFYNSRGKLNIRLDIVPCYIESEEDFNDIADVIGREFDFIVTSKAIGEFERKNRISQNGYEFFSTLFAPLLSKDGLMIILDVTTKNEQSGLFLSQQMNIGVNNFLAKSSNHFKSIAPCEGILNGNICTRNCFFKKEIFVSHSEKSKDLTKFAVRIVTRRESALDKSIFGNVLRNPDCVIYKL